MAAIPLKKKLATCISGAADAFGACGLAPMLADPSMLYLVNHICVCIGNVPIKPK
jgi:hypothetical protein